MARFFFFNDTATTEIYTLSLHDALPISVRHLRPFVDHWHDSLLAMAPRGVAQPNMALLTPGSDRKSTRLNSSHTVISYAVFCLKKQDHTRLRSPSLDHFPGCDDAV